MKIVKADQSFRQICAELLFKTELGKRYFINHQNEYIGFELLKEGFDKDTIYLAESEKGQIIGFSWFQERGIFNWFPYLHVLVVDPAYQNTGYGTALLNHFETLCYQENNAVDYFLAVGDYNIKAKSLYEKSGYQVVGPIKDLYIKGVSEILIHKIRSY
ncbi:MAG TPA: GNAT family N-acetyltransferase [Candidatus Cloacimonadota bacterium]|nr:GNAT family N-acetyltransferase [Candidatus Cloacimonadota bacterium]